MNRLTVVDVEPATDFRPAPQAITCPRIGYRCRESSRPPFIRDKQANTFASTTGTCGDVGHGNQPATSQPNHFDIGKALKVRDRRQNSGLRTRGIPIEIQVLYSVSTTDKRIITSVFKKDGHGRIALQIRAFHYQSKMVRRHMMIVRILSSIQCGHRRSARRICFAWFPGLRGVDQIETWQPALPGSLHFMTPQRCPSATVIVHPAASASARASSTSFFGWRVLAMPSPRTEHVLH